MSIVFIKFMLENVLANNHQNVKMRNEIVMRKVLENSQRIFAGVAYAT